MICCVAKGLFLKSLDSIQSFMGRPAVFIHQLLHQSIRPIGDAFIQIRNDLVVTGKRIEPKRSQLMRAELVHTSLNSGDVPLG